MLVYQNSSFKELWFEKGICCNEKVQNWIISDEKSVKGAKQPTRTMNKDRTEGGRWTGWKPGRESRECGKTLQELRKFPSSKIYMWAKLWFLKKCFAMSCHGPQVDIALFVCFDFLDQSTWTHWRWKTDIGFSRSLEARCLCPLRTKKIKKETKDIF